jgi:hypothetical protein
MEKNSILQHALYGFIMQEVMIVELNGGTSGILEDINHIVFMHL